MSHELAIIGEAWGEQEEKERRPFCGATGWELTNLLSESGIVRADCFLTNVFNLRPQGNRIETLCGDRGESVSGYPALIKGKYVREEFQGELDRLADEIEAANPNLILCLGNTAAWAMLGRTAISKLRGTTFYSTHTISGFKVLPTYHPAAIFRQYDLRPTVLMDIMKASRECKFPDIRRPARQIWIEPTLPDIQAFKNQFITGCKILSVDIETAGTQITCIGFAPSHDLAIVIPFLDTRKKDRNYWPDKKSERGAWEIIREILEDREIPKLFQNGMYDIAFIWRAWGMRVYGAEEDTMLLHHALYPEALKGLGFLGSIYTDEGSWKDMRKVATIKKDD